MKKCWILREYRHDYIERSYYDSFDIAYSVAVSLAKAGLTISLVFAEPITEYNRKGVNYANS